MGPTEYFLRGGFPFCFFQELYSVELRSISDSHDINSDRNTTVNFIQCLTLYNVIQCLSILDKHLITPYLTFEETNSKDK